MKSGLDGRNNPEDGRAGLVESYVSMKSGLDGRNNVMRVECSGRRDGGLNEVRPRWPEQCPRDPTREAGREVSMKSGLDGRNNGSPRKAALTRDFTSTCELSA